jgi:hypothetical protein
VKLDIGYGVVRQDGDAYFKAVAPKSEWIIYENWPLLLEGLREQHGTINVTISEGLMNERFRYTVWEMPWEEGEI